MRRASFRNVPCRNMARCRPRACTESIVDPVLLSLYTEHVCNGDILCLRSWNNVPMIQQQAAIVHDIQTIVRSVPRANDVIGPILLLLLDDSDLSREVLKELVDNLIAYDLALSEIRGIVSTMGF